MRSFPQFARPVGDWACLAGEILNQLSSANDSLFTRSDPPRQPQCRQSASPTAPHRRRAGVLNPDGDWRESGLDPVAVRQLNVRPSVVIDVQGKFDFFGSFNYLHRRHVRPSRFLVFHLATGFRICTALSMIPRGTLRKAVSRPAVAWQLATYCSTATANAAETAHPLACSPPTAPPGMVHCLPTCFQERTSASEFVEPLKLAR